MPAQLSNGAMPLALATGCAAAAFSPFAMNAFVMPTGQRAQAQMGGDSRVHSHASVEHNPLGLAALASGTTATLLLAAGRLQRAQRRSRVSAAPPGAADVEAPTEKTTASEAPPPPPYNPADEMGVGPFGFFDPLGFTNGKDEAGFRKLRTSELKHGRVAMMASVGAIGQHFIKFPFFEKTTGTFGALGYPPGVIGFTAIFVVSGIVELAWREEPTSRWAGDYGDPFNVNMMSEEMRNKEVNNGRMAMISVLGIFAAELATGKDAVEQFGL